jgi:hypothetical protein
MPGLWWLSRLIWNQIDKWQASLPPSAEDLIAFSYDGNHWFVSPKKDPTNIIDVHGEYIGHFHTRAEAEAAIPKVAAILAGDKAARAAAVAWANAKEERAAREAKESKKLQEVLNRPPDIFYCSPGSDLARGFGEGWVVTHPLGKSGPFKSREEAEAALSQIIAKLEGRKGESKDKRS